jgi:hypothetical protein
MTSEDATLRLLQCKNAADREDLALHARTLIQMMISRETNPQKYNNITIRDGTTLNSDMTAIFSFTFTVYNDETPLVELQFFYPGRSSVVLVAFQLMDLQKETKNFEKTPYEYRLSNTLHITKDVYNIWKSAFTTIGFFL